ncbi:MAG: gamma-glutamylcyclotransferase [Alphaproteobacteria bacterium]|nr:gamma-glutamylcyclotransferase [Alphaproteobacteria bacterium]
MQAEPKKTNLRLTRELVDRLPARVDERGPDQLFAPDPDYHERTARSVIEELGADNELWVFAIGSLIWNPRFEVVERRVASASGWKRSFCYGPETRYRGSPAAPGYMLSMDRGEGQCWGVALRMAPKEITAALTELLKQEPPFPPEWIEIETEDGPMQAIAFTAFRDFFGYQPEPPEHELADILASAVGHVGSMADYLLNTVTQLEAAGIHDPHLWRLQELVARRLEKLPPQTQPD